MYNKFTVHLQSKALLSFALDEDDKIWLFFQKKIILPGECYNPYFAQTSETRTKLGATALQAKIVSNAIEILEDPGTPFYFKCGAKKYMAIMAQVILLYKLQFVENLENLN